MLLIAIILHQTAVMSHDISVYQQLITLFVEMII